jgi:hypothetical protein
VEQILDRVISDWRTADWEEAKWQPMWRHREAANRAIAMPEAEQELQENLGSGAPQLVAATLHPWVWGSVAGLWSSGHYREAVGAAARAVSVQAQANSADGTPLRPSCSATPSRATLRLPATRGCA